MSIYSCAQESGREKRTSATNSIKGKQAASSGFIELPPSTTLPESGKVMCRSTVGTNEAGIQGEPRRSALAKLI